MMKCCLMSSDVSWHIKGQVVTNAEAWFNKSLRPRKPEGSLGRTAQDVHLDSHYSSWNIWHTHIKVQKDAIYRAKHTTCWDKLTPLLLIQTQLTPLF